MTKHNLAQAPGVEVQACSASLLFLPKQELTLALLREGLTAFLTIILPVIIKKESC